MGNRISESVIWSENEQYETKSLYLMASKKKIERSNGSRVLREIEHRLHTASGSESNVVPDSSHIINALKVIRDGHNAFPTVDFFIRSVLFPSWMIRSQFAYVPLARVADGTETIGGYEHPSTSIAELDDRSVFNFTPSVVREPLKWVLDLQNSLEVYIRVFTSSDTFWDLPGSWEHFKNGILFLSGKYQTWDFDDWEMFRLVILDRGNQVGAAWMIIKDSDIAQRGSYLTSAGYCGSTVR